MNDNIVTEERNERDSATDSRDVLIRQLRWRYATKQFDPARRISDADWAALEAALVLTPSSFGLQPWRFYVVTNQHLKDRMVAASWNQRQVADASHVVVFAIRRNLDAEHIDRYVKRIMEVRGVDEASLATYRHMMHDALLGRPPVDSVDHWSARQVYIALGNFMTSAALLGVDVCPMEGIEPARYDEILGITGEPYTTQVVAAAGYRSSDDRYAHLPKVRFDAKDVIHRIE